jgi:hypothetical protein
MRPLLLAGLLVANAAVAQISQAITDAQLTEPWTQARTFVASVPAGAAVDPEKAARDARALGESLAVLRARLEDTAISIVARPEFAYDAAQASFDLSRDVGEAAARLDAWLQDFPPDTVAAASGARAGIARLQETLAQRHAFERDVLQTLGSGSKNAIQALARRWWTAAEQVDALREAVVPPEP